MNDIEKQNIKLFQDQTKQLKIAQNELTHQLKTFKELVLTNNNSELKSTFGFYYENSNDEFEPRNLKEVLSKTDLNDINYYKSNGLNSTITDNGFVKIIYKISISGKSIDLFYNFMSHTDFVDQIDEFTDYQSESEYMCNWQFEFINDKLRFKRFVIAG